MPNDPWTEIPAPAGDAFDALAQLPVQARWPALVDVAAEVADLLAERRIVVVGAGSIGLHLIEGLARLRVRSIRIVDPATTKLESVLTHPIGAHEVGAAKARLAGERARAISPQTEVAIHPGPFQSLPPHALLSCDAVLLATDNLAVEIAVSQQALWLGIPLIQASVHGGTLTAQLRCVGSGEDSACLACGFSRAEFESLDRGTRFACGGADAAEGRSGPPAAPEPSPIPTASFPALCGLAAQLALIELLRRTLGLGADAAPPDELIEYRGYLQEIVRTPLARRPDCSLDHSRFSVCTADEPLAGCSLRDLLRMAGLPDRELSGISVVVPDHRFATLSFCECPDHPRLDRMIPAGEEPPPCPDCGACRRDHPLYCFERVPGAVLTTVMDLPLAELGAPTAACVLLRGEPGTTLVRGPHPRRRPLRHPLRQASLLHCTSAGEAPDECSVGAGS